MLNTVIRDWSKTSCQHPLAPLRGTGAGQSCLGGGEEGLKDRTRQRRIHRRTDPGAAGISMVTARRRVRRQHPHLGWAQGAGQEREGGHRRSGLHSAMGCHAEPLQGQRWAETQSQRPGRLSASRDVQGQRRLWRWRCTGPR
ncbi:uncharacterized protein ACIBXB_021642 isoform 1-T1 [Morphnus guianensis]